MWYRSHVRRRDERESPALDAVTSRVFNDRAGRVEPHGLAVDQRRGEDRGMMALEPARDIDQERETGGVRLGEPVLPEPLDLLIDGLGVLGVNATIQHPLDELHADGVEFTAFSPRAHGSAKLVGFAEPWARGENAVNSTPSA